MDMFHTFVVNFVDAAWIIEILVLAVSWVVICGSAKKWIEWVLHILLLTVIFATCNFLTFAVMGGVNNFFTSYWGYVHGMLSAIYVWHNSPYHKKTKILMWLALYTSILATTSLSGQCSVLYGKYVQRGAMEGVIRCCVFFVILLTSIILRRYKFDEFQAVPKSGLVLIAVMNICIQVLMLSQSYFFEAGDAVLIVLTFVFASMLLTSLASIKAMYTMCSEQNDIIILQAERQKYLADKEISKMAESTLEDLKLIRHDLNNQFSYCQILLEEERYDELSDYFSKLKEHLPVQLNLTDCGNKTMNTVLNMEFSKLRAKGIEVETQLVVPPVLPFRDEDICAIVSNLLDNALDECVRLKEKGKDDVKVRIEIYPHQSYLYIRCLNSTDRDSIDHLGRGLRTTKSDKSVHGYGTRIISKQAEKYNGCADFNLEDGMFVATVMMDMVGRNIK